MTAECTPNGAFENIILRDIITNALNAEMDEVCEYEKLIPEKNERNTRGNKLCLPAGDIADDEHPSKNGNYDEALEEAGFGKFTVLLTLICGWANASDGVEILSVSFLLPSAEKDLGLSSSDKGLLNSIIFVGMLIGSYGWGSLADIQGRRKILMYSLTCNAIFGLASSFAQEFWLFLIFRLFSGIGVGAAGPIIFSYFGEFQQRKRRGMMISIVAFFWLAANLMTAALAWLVIPSSIGFHNDNGFSYESWRVFVALCTLPSVTSVFTFYFLPDSPKFLLENGKAEEALEVMKKVFVWNNKGVKPSDYSIAVLLPSSKSRKPLTHDTRQKGIRGCCSKTLKETVTIAKGSIMLFKAPLRRASIPMYCIIFTLAFGYYGLWLWFPQLFLQVESGSGSVCNGNIINSTLHNSTGDDNSIYKDTFYTALSNLPGNLIAIFFLDIVGRKVLLSGSLILSGISVFFIYLVQTRIQVLIMSCVFGGISVIAWNTISVLGVEIYPTNVRTTAMGLQSVANRIGAILGNIAFGVLIDKNCAVPILMVAGLLSIGGIITLILPNTLKKVLQ